jgi:hypothetical protein
MAERLHRTQILLEPEQHRALAEIARREGRSLSDVVREMLRQQIEHQKNVAEAVIERRLAALDRIRRQNEEALALRGGKPLEIDISELLNRARKERDERNLGFALDSGD